MRSLRGISWRWLTAVVVGVAVVAGSAGYAAAHLMTGGLNAGLPGSTPGQATAAAPSASPVAAAGAPVVKPEQAQAQANSRRSMGEVVGISPAPATFTIMTPAGAQTTFRVLDTTVFAAGQDRPYNFELLKTGDQVTVRGGAGAKGAGVVKVTPEANAAAPAVQPNAPAPKPGGTAKQPGQAKPGRANAARSGAPADGALVARQVMVRPAGEAGKRNLGQRQGQAAARPNGAGQGGSNVAGQ
jgi:hypothetical protein